MKKIFTVLRYLCLLAVFGFPAMAGAADIDRFVGTYNGQAEDVVGQEAKRRDMSTTISATKDGFRVSWTSVTYQTSGSSKEKSYSIEFLPSQRDSIYGSAMKTNVFGKSIPLDPLQGEPFVWARFEDDTFSVFSLFINEIGEYELQEFHRTLAPGGLDLVFRSLNKGVAQKEITAFLERQN